VSESTAGNAGGLLFVQPNGDASDEGAAALAWLCGLRDFEVQPVSLARLGDVLPGPDSAVWFHWTEAPSLSEANRRVLDAHVRAGGGLLATLAAVTLPVQLGWEETGPDEVNDALWSEEPDDSLARSFSTPSIVRGLQSFRGHPLFDGLGSGTYTWAPKHGEPFVRYAYTGGHWPKAGRVIAVQKSFIAMNSERRLAWEYMVGDGWAVCIGGYVHFAARDTAFRPHLERLVRNALRRVAPNVSGVHDLGGTWVRPRRGLRLEDEIALPPPLGPTAMTREHADTVLERSAAKMPFTLAGSRAVLIGDEQNGLEEVWFHPFRAVSHWSLEPAAGSTDTAGAMVSPAHVKVSPGLVARRFSMAEGAIEERTVVARDEAAILVELDREGPPVPLKWTMESDLRLMWPYPAHATGRLAYAVEGGAFGLASDSGQWLGVRIEPAPAVMWVEDASADDRSRVRISAELELRSSARIVVVGATREERRPQRIGAATFESGLEGEGGERFEGLSLVCGDTELEEAVRWACRRLASYRVVVPELGASLVAGYASSRSTPFGDGRPGYAWYFGRDACWTSLASLAVGQFGRVREVLEFLARHQDITGKILHECTTSGAVHYDAADSTPLYLLLAARYFAWTGDVETIERLWPSILRAHAFCLATDTDGDGLIENTGVGHGWIEFGRLGGHHVSLYLASVWVAALDELEVTARALGRKVFADQLGYQSAVARASLELSFYDPLEAQYANGRRSDGTLDMAETVMTAVPLALGAVRAERCSSWLDRVASEDFSTPWGVRLVPRSESEYRPDGYHGGAVWPLYTGWVSLAEYRAARYESAYRHWAQTARLYRQNALGAWPEVLHGDEPRSLGLTSDQAWSTAMAVLPLVEGLLGVKPAAVAGRVEIEPQLPADWSRGGLGRLRVGGSWLSIAWAAPEKRGSGEVDVRCDGPPLEVSRVNA
jgi:glycogen debranching enzyme